MSTITKLLAGRNINTDSDFSKYIETVSEAGVINGLQVSTNKVGVGKCWVSCERTNGETIYALVDSKTEITIDTSGTGYVVVSIPQTMIDDGSLINEDGTGVATISVVNELPTKNYLELAELDSGVITDKRNVIKKLGEINTTIEGMEDDIEDLDERVEALETVGAIDHLEQQALVGELYTMSDTLFVQRTPNKDGCIIEQNVGDVDGNKEIHIQRMGSGVASNKLKLKVKMYGEPITNLKVEVREGVKVVVTENVEAYWYGDETKVLATGSLAYTEFSTDWEEFEITLSANVGGTRGQLLDVVVYQEASGSEIVSASNYYAIACDGKQWSEAFSLVKVNGTTRSRSKLMPYCISDGFADKLIVKYSETIVKGYGIELYDLPDEATFNGLSQGSEVDDTATLYNNQNSEAQTVSFIGDWYVIYSNYPYNTLIYYNIDGNKTLFMNKGSSSGWFNNEGLNNISIPSGSYWCIRWSGSYQNANYGATGKRKNYKAQIKGNKDTTKKAEIKSNPKEVKDIGQLTEIIIFGITDDGSFLFQVEKSEQTDMTYSINRTQSSNSFIVPTDGYLTYTHNVESDGGIATIYLNDKLLEKRTWTGSAGDITRYNIYVKKGTKISYKTSGNNYVSINITFSSF